jgi:hypothetical protein
MISCRPHYLPREFSSILFVAVYLPPQNKAGTKTALNQLYKAISKEEKAHPEAGTLIAGDVKLKSVLPNVQPEGEKKTTFTPPAEMHKKLSSALHLANLTIIISS